MKSSFFKLIVAAMAVGLTFSCEKDGLNGVCVTGECTDIGETSAKLFGWCKKNGVEGASVLYGIQYSATDLTTDAWSAYAEGKDSKNKYSCQVGDLRPNTLYYYRAFTYDNGVTSYGKVKTFKTLDYTATVTTLDATEVTEIRATLRGSVNVKSKDNLPMRCWFLISDTETDLEALKNNGRVCHGELSEDGAFCHAYEPRDRGESWLKPNTKYNYVAVADVCGAEIYGEVKSFTTFDISGEVITTDATDVTEYSAVLHGRVLSIDCKEFYEQRVGFFYSYTATTLEDLIENGKGIQCTLSEDGSFQVSKSGLPVNKVVYFVAFSQIVMDGTSSSGAFYSGAGSKLIFGEVKSFSLLNTPEFVDLGLSVKWGNWNLGGASPEDYGEYFAWGETESKSNYDWSTYKWCNGSSTSLTKYNTDSSYGIVDNKTTLEPEDDAAHVKLGGNWRIPTDAEWTELITNCTSTWVYEYHGINREGQLYTAANGNSIFIPCAGARHLYNGVRYEDPNANYYAYYWTSSLGENSREAVDRGFRAQYMYRDYHVDRSCGLSIRPVCE